MKCYDASALAKFHAGECGTDAVRASTRADPQPCRAAITGAEAPAASGGAVRVSRLSRSEARRAFIPFRQEWRGMYAVLPVDSEPVEAAGNLARRDGLKGLDATYLACTHRADRLYEEPCSLVTCDLDLWQDAGAEGLGVFPAGLAEVP